MTEITIRSFAKYRDLFGAEIKIDVPIGGTIADALIIFAGERLEAQKELYENSILKSYIVIMYNRERIDIEDVSEILLNDHDEIVLYPPVSGG